MKKSLIFAAACLFTVAGMGNSIQAQAEEPAMDEQKLSSLESDLFVTLDSAVVFDDTKAAEALINDGAMEENGDAKCWWWCCRPRYYYYPTYYYYSWYCPCYHVPFRLITYTVPVRYVTTIVSPGVAAVNQTVNYSSETNYSSSTSYSSSSSFEYKASGSVARGAVVNGTIPANSPLKKMGLRSGDIIVKIDGNKVDSLADVQRAKANSKIVYIRGDQIKTNGRQILQKANDDVAVKSFSEKVSGEQLEEIGQKLGSEGKTLYEYYDMLEKDAVVK